MRSFAIFCLLIVLSGLPIFLFAQNADSLETEIADSNLVIQDSLLVGIPDYNKYTPLLGGKEFRMRNGLKINGMVKDYYPDSTLKHKGYYQNGQLVSTYRNYYPNGNPERIFAASGTNKLIIQLFYPDGKPREYTEYYKGEIIRYVDYYPSGDTTSFELHDKKKGYYIVLKNYYPNGILKDELQLLDKKKRVYHKKEYYPNGQVREEGTIIYNPVLYDYRREGEWKVYNEQGKLVETRTYYEGELIQ